MRPTFRARRREPMRVQTRFLALVAGVLSIVTAAAPADAAVLTYAVGQNGQFGTMELTTGVFTPIGLPTVNWLGIARANDGTLYGADATKLYTIDPLTG